MVNNKKLLSVALSAAMVLSTITAPLGKLSTVNAEASGKNNIIFRNKSSKRNIADKIEKTLKDDFKTSTSKVTFLVKLNDQVDTVNVAKKAVTKAATQGLTAYKTNLLKKSSIVSELKIKSNDTQRSIKTYLDSQKKKGNVTKYKSFYIVNGIAVTGTEAVMNELAAMPEVESISENKEIKLNYDAEQATGASASLQNNESDSNIGTNVLQVGANEAWALGINGSGITIGSLDTGVQWNHPALKTKYRGYDPSNPDVPNNECNWYDATSDTDTQGNPYDDVDHGTHTVGTMVGSCADGTNQIGVAPGAKWIAAKAFTSNGGDSAAILLAAQWLLAPVDNNGNTHPELAPDIINNSWGSGTAGADDWFRQVVINWKAAGILPEFSAGNVTQYDPAVPGSVSVPGAYPESFATGAVDSDNNLADFSLRGPSPYGVLKPDVSAPGVGIRSSLPGNAYGIMSGTSMAGPCTSAVAALVMQADPSLTVDQVEEVLKNTATQRTDSAYPTSPNNGYGYGVVNAYMAVASVLQNGEGVGKIAGQVLKEGQDTVPPTYTEPENPVDQAYSGGDTALSITANDDVSIKTVELQYIHNDGDQWSSVASAQMSGDYRGGSYTAVIPGAQVTGTSLQYRWRIVDFGNHEIFTDVHTIKIIQTIKIGYFTDFETQPAGWTTYGTDASGPAQWSWGTPTCGIGRAASGTKVYATNLSGHYTDDADIYLELPPIDVPASGSADLNFKKWYNIDSSDYCSAYVSTDHVNWEEWTWDSNSMGNDYINAYLPLDWSYPGQRVYVRFGFHSDDSANSDGFFLDDVGFSTQTVTNSIAAKLVGRKVMKENTVTTKYNTSSESPVSGLPLSGKVTVLENGHSANTSPADGSYGLTEKAGDYTLQAEAYGYYPQTHSVTVSKDSVADNVNFMLNPIPKGLLTGKITNAQTGEPIANAALYLVEDAAVTPVFTDSEGNYSLNAYEGNYTLRASAANYYDKSVSVGVTGNGTVTQDIQLKPYVGYSGQISYDDDTAEEGTAANSANTGFGVRMTLADGKDTAMLTTGMFKFWNESWPNPGGTNFKIAVYDATGENGAPGNKIAGPFDATAIRDENQWTTVDLSTYGVTVPHDFYLVYVQADAYPNCPAIAEDLSSECTYRNFVSAGGSWSQMTVNDGNLMIRSAVNYEVKTPVIAVPHDNFYTNSSTVTVTGTAGENADLHILNNNKEAAVVTPDSNGSFSADIALAEGDNVLKAYSSGLTGRTDYSDETKVILDTAAPVLNVISPDDNLKTDKEALNVQGTVADTNLDNVEVNGIKADVNTDGTWTARIPLTEGVNTVETVASDKAGNKTTKTIKTDAKFGIQEITNLMPDQDICLNSGKSVKVEFDSEPGLKKAVFMIHMPSADNEISGINTFAVDNLTEFPMTEIKDNNGNGTGHYEGYWTATSDLSIRGAQIEVRVSDYYGNTLSGYAGGKLYVNGAENIKVNRVSGINRYETSENAAEAYGNGQKVANIILTSGTNFPDALSGTILTSSLKAPMLLVGSGEDNTKAYDYIKNYLTDGGKVYILGGTGAVSQNVEDYVTKTLNKSVIRISGADRFETNKKIIDTFNPAKGTPVIITTSENFADALSVSSVAAIKGYPIVLVKGNHLSASASDAIKDIQPSLLYVIGGTGAVNDNIITEIKAADTSLTDAEITRIGGADRYETSLKVLKQFNLNKGNLVVTTGTGFADALSGTALAAKENAPILLTDSDVLKNQLSIMSKYTYITVIGGYAAVTADAENYLNGKTALPASIQTSLTMTVSVGSMIVLPETVIGYYADGGKITIPVIWDKYACLDASKAGILTVTGTVDGYDTPVTLTITVK